MRIKMCSIHVDDPAAAFEFYTGTLGFEELVAMPEYRLFVVKSPDDPDGVGLLLEPSDNPVAKAYQEGVRGLGLPAIVFGTADVQAEYERLRGLGVTVHGRTDHGSVRHRGGLRRRLRQPGAAAPGLTEYGGGGIRYC